MLARPATRRRTDPAVVADYNVPERVGEGRADHPQLHGLREPVRLARGVIAALGLCSVDLVSPLSMKILILSNYFPPEIGAGPRFPYELGETLSARGHEVTVVTGFPRYNCPEMPQKYRGKLLFREDAEGMTVLRVNTPVMYGSWLTRALVHFVAPPILLLRVSPCPVPM